jgi:hypothetical protein
MYIIVWDGGRKSEREEKTIESQIIKLSVMLMINGTKESSFCSLQACF